MTRATPFATTAATMSAAPMLRAHSSVRRIFIALFPILCAGVAGCSFSDIVGDPSSTSEVVVNPDAVKTPQGALEFYRGVIKFQALAVNDMTLATGLLTDELRLYRGSEPLDYRVLPAMASVDLYTRLQITRANARQARGILPKYAPALPVSYIAHLYAIEATADVMLADLFCSGIPLSTVDFDGDFTPHAGSATQAVYQAAVALFDSAIVLSADSARIRHFAQVGKGRTLLALGDFAAAAVAVTDVPTAYVYQAEYRYAPSIGLMGNVFLSGSGGGIYTSSVTVSDREGGTGVPYISSGDPRSATRPYTNAGGLILDIAQKYDTTGETPIVIASGIEARLIEAEAALRASDVPAWAGILNDLRASAGAFLDSTVPPIPALGTDSTTALSQDERVNLLFRERAYWLFLTGHRQGDLRRLVRRVDNGGFGRPQETVYPSGPYINLPQSAPFPPSVYGTDVSIAVPLDEQQRNKLYTGCINRQA